MSATVGYVVLAAAALLGLVAWRARRPGEPWEHAVDRLLNNDEHKEREANRRAGLGDE